jgi:transaldolase
MMELKVKLFADGADKNGILEMYANPLISGFTTNPTLMKAAGITDYKLFAHDILTYINDKPISFEVFSDDFDEMEKQALDIASWGANVNVKIPISNTKSESSIELINSLSLKGVSINVTAMMTVNQVKGVIPGLSKGPGGFVSVFAGRIADAGQDPVPIMTEVVNILKDYPNIKLIWASPRELYNVVQADLLGCHIITATNNILKKLPTLGKDLDQFSLETVKMFYNDATEAGYTL